jgi:trehalose/maltose hydrolase-like predicted phosphorylase
VIDSSLYPVEPWTVRETRFEPDQLAHAESIFALSNGHIGLRGNLDEGEPHGIPGTYLNSFYELRPLPYAEAGYGYPESGQTVVDVTNGKIIRLLVDDEPFDIRYGELCDHERVLDLQTGTLRRRTEWVSPADKRVRVTSTRLVSFTHRSIAAVEFVVEPLDGPARLIVQSELVANEDQPARSGDPRVAAVLERPLDLVHGEANRTGAMLVHRTRRSGLLMAAGMDHVVEAPGRVEVSTDTRDDWARTTVVSLLQPGQRLRIVKYVGYGWSSQRSTPSLRDQVAAALTGAGYTGWDGLAREQREYLDTFWDAADVEVDGDADLQQAVRFALFHVLQAGARAERRAIPGKGLTGPGYDGHAFWDTEGFVLPVLTYTMPAAAADALHWRHSTLDMARERARTLGLGGATFPWRTIRGQECSGYWPAGTAAFHVNADVADAFERYRIVTGDDSVERDAGVEVLVETARLWMSLGHHGPDGRWHIAGVTGPDEYSAIADDNVFTNLMAARNLRVAAEACGRHPAEAAATEVTADEVAAWRRAAETVFVPYDERLGVHPQSDRFTMLDEWPFDETQDQYPLLLSQPYVQLYRKQVIKQADLVLAMHWCGESFTDEQKARNVDYYERRTVRDSSLSACTQAIMAAEVGHLDLAYDYAHEAALIDLRDLHHNTKDGLHMASLGGAWLSLVAGFGGLRDTEGCLCLAPQLPAGMTRLSFRIMWRGMRLQVEVTPGGVVYRLRDGADASLTFRHDGEDVTVRAGEPLEMPLVKRSPLLPRPEQPPGCEPLDRQAFRNGQQTVLAARSGGGRASG